jgi:hypothetical protein
VQAAHRARAPVVRDVRLDEAGARTRCGECVLVPGAGEEAPLVLHRLDLD